MWRFGKIPRKVNSQLSFGWHFFGCHGGSFLGNYLGCYFAGFCSFSDLFIIWVEVLFKSFW